MGDFEGDCSLDGVIVKVSRRFNLFWIPHDWGYKLGPLEGLTHPIKEVRIGDFEETAVLMGLL